MTTTATRPAPALPGDWRDHAACRGADPEIFFVANEAPDGWATYDWSKWEAAQRYCKACPATKACLADAVSVRDEVSIRGGLTGWQRRMARKEKRVEQIGPAPTATDGRPATVAAWVVSQPPGRRFTLGVIATDLGTTAHAVSRALGGGGVRDRIAVVSPQTKNSPAVWMILTKDGAAVDPGAAPATTNIMGAVRDVVDALQPGDRVDAAGIRAAAGLPVHTRIDYAVVECVKTGALREIQRRPRGIWEATGE